MDLYFNGKGAAGEDFEITYPDAIPLNELFAVIDDHFAHRKELQRLRKELEDRTYQFRVIQKRLLNRFKDKNPSPLNNLDFLLNHTYIQIVEASTHYEQLRASQSLSADRLSASLELILKLIQIRFKISEEEFDMLRAHFSCEPSVISSLDDSENSWEDVTNASLSYLLKNALGKAGGGGNKQGGAA